MDDEEGSNFCNSGIYFRGRIVNPAMSQMTGYQLDLVLNSKMPTILGAMAGEINGTEKMLTKVGESVAIQPGGVINVTGRLGDTNKLLGGFKDRGWNTYRVIAVGNNIQCYINDTLTSSATEMRPDGAMVGQLGFQMMARKPMIVQFRNIKLKQLKAVLPSSPTATTPNSQPAIQTDPNQPRIEVLKDQGPNALEWALAPLDQPLPPDIRQNLTYLREDLLDEAKQKPKAGTNAYTLGSQLCDKLLIAIQQRGQASVQAGYTAAQADADVRVSSQALEARRNYQMSWPQFARETSQRAEISRQQMSAAELKKEKTKVEWASRADVMRPILDGLYRQFREALR